MRGAPFPAAGVPTGPGSAALMQALDAHKAGRGNLHELEQGMRSDEQTKLGN